jgi:hypothetical protein
LQERLKSGGRVTVRDLLRNPAQRERSLELILLLVQRSTGSLLLPEDSEELDAGDRLLLCGRPAAFGRLFPTLTDDVTLDWVLTGAAQPRSWIWRRLARARRT